MAKKADQHFRNATALCGIGLTLAVVVMELGGMLAPLEAFLYDKRCTYFQQFRPTPTDKIVHLDIDDGTLSAIGAWPWKRSLVASLIDEIQRAGPKAIALDVLFTERQEKEWNPTSEGQFRLVDHDVVLAKSFDKAADVLVPTSLLFMNAQLQSRAIEVAASLLEKDLELNDAEIIAGLTAANVPEKDLADPSTFLPIARRAATESRVRAAMKQIAARATTQPASQPSNRVEAETDLILAQLQRELLPRTGGAVKSNAQRAIVDAYDRARSLLSLHRFGRPRSAELPPLFRAAGEVLPVPELIGAANASAFVDYPTFGDGTVRFVPMLVDHDGQVLPQMGLSIACMLLDVTPGELQVTPDTITIPAGKLKDGTPRKEIRIPVRTLPKQETGATGQPMPMVFDIPWIGDKRWWAMFDPEHPALNKQHLPLMAAYEAVLTQQKIVENNRRVDNAIRTAIAITDPDGAKAVAAYDSSRGPLEEASSRLPAINSLLEKLKALDIKPDAKVDLPGQSEEENRVIRSAHELWSAQSELPKLAAQLETGRKALKSALAGKAALIGWTATAAVADIKPTSIHSAAPGVVAHGTIVNAILTGELWRTLPVWVTIVVTLLIGLAATAIVTYFPPAPALGASIALAAVYLLINALVLFDYGNLILGAAAPMVTIGAVWSSGTLSRLILEARERARITRRFGSYVDPALVDYLLEHRDQAVFSGQEREISVVFTDLEGFTSLSEAMGKAIVPLLNDFMGRATPVIQRHRGYINKFLGDGIMFFMNAPRPTQTYAPDAVGAILDLQSMLGEFNKELTEKGLPNLKIRAGCTTGEVIVGDAGSSERSDYTVLGDFVNLSARLESANKYTGTSNLVTDRTMELAGSKFLFRPVGRLQVVGLQSGVMVYETLAYADQATEQHKRLVELSKAMVDCFAAARPADCIEAVEKLEAEFGASKLTKMYKNYCRRFLDGEVEGEFVTQLVLAEK